MVLLHAPQSRFVCKEVERPLRIPIKSNSTIPYLTGDSIFSNQFISERPGDFPNLVKMLTECNHTIADRVLFLLSEVYNNRIPIDNREIIRAVTIQIYNVWIKDYGDWVINMDKKGETVGASEVITYLSEIVKEKVRMTLEYWDNHKECFAFFRDIRSFIKIQFLLETFNFKYYDREQLELVEAELEWLNKKIPDGPIDDVNQRFLLQCMERSKEMLFGRKFKQTTEENYETFRFIQKDGVWFFKEFTAVSLSCDLWITEYSDDV